jgi:hypothetical protein
LVKHKEYADEKNAQSHNRLILYREEKGLLASLVIPRNGASKAKNHLGRCPR